MLGVYDGKTIRMQEVHRFTNDPVLAGGTFYWDILRLFHEIKQGLLKAASLGGFETIGIDTWGVDFGLLDGAGRLLGNPVHYRDQRTEGIPQEVESLLSRKELYRITGIQHMRINTVYQLAYLSRHEKETLARAKTLLLIPDLLSYYLTGEKRGEVTNASTTSVFDPRGLEWSSEVCARLGIPAALLPKTIATGEIYGGLSPALCEELGCPNAKVVAVPTHDTASAVASVPTQEPNFAYISSGTWSLLGTELDAPVLTERAQAENFTNEIGFAGKTRFLKNIMGLWLIQESRRQWIREGNEASFAELEREALAAEPFRCFIDPDAPAFETPGNLPDRVRRFCAETGQSVPETRGEVVRCIYESLALKYRYSLGRLSELCEKRFTQLNIVGGGIKDTLLCTMAANACGIRVSAGPAEATAFGNIASQLYALGELKSLSEMREVISRSTQLAVYEPDDTESWQKAAQRFQEMLELSRNTNIQCGSV